MAMEILIEKDVQNVQKSVGYMLWRREYESIKYICMKQKKKVQNRWDRGHGILRIKRNK